MQSNAVSRWAPRLSALLVAALLGASLVAWALRWPAADGASRPAGEGTPRTSITTAATYAAQSNATVNAAALARALGTASGASTTASPESTEQRYRLTGFVAASTGRGAALIAVQDQRPRAFHIGSKVDDGLVLQWVGQRSARLGPDLHGPTSITLELPAPTSSSP